MPNSIVVPHAPSGAFGSGGVARSNGPHLSHLSIPGAMSVPHSRHVVRVNFMPVCLSRHARAGYAPIEGLIGGESACAWRGPGP